MKTIRARRFTKEPSRSGALHPVLGSLAGAAGILIACIFVYQPVMSGAFIWDDHGNIEDNPLVHASDGLYHFWFTTENVDYWPLTSTTWWLEWRMWGRDTTGYHVVNLALHAAGAILLWLILRRLKVMGAWVIAAAFAVHPVNVESVAWITERKNTLSMFLGMLSTWLYLRSGAVDDSQTLPGAELRARSRRESSTAEAAGIRTRNVAWGCYVASLFAFILGLLAKTSIVTLPAVFLLLVIWRKKSATLFDALRLIPYFVCSAAMAAATLWFQYHRSIANTPIRDDHFLSRFAVAGKAVWFYLYKLIVPRQLSFVYSRWNIGAVSIASLLPAMLLALLIVALVIVWRRGGPWVVRGPGIALIAYIVLLLPVLGFFNIYFMRYALVSDHWQYIPSAAGLCLVIGGATWLMGRLGVPGQASAGAAAVMLVSLCVLAHRQSRIYANEGVLWRDTLAKNPKAWMAATNLAVSLSQEGRDDEAIPYWNVADRASPQNPTILIGEGLSFARVGRTQEGLAMIRRGIAVAPAEEDGYFTLGLVHTAGGRYEDAIGDFREAIRHGGQPPNPDSHVDLGVALAHLGRYAEAIAEYEAALRIGAGFDAQFNLGIAQSNVGNLKAASRAFQAARQLAPADPRPCTGLGIIFEKAGNLQTAEMWYREARQLQSK